MVPSTDTGDATKEQSSGEQQPSGDEVKEAWETACAAAIKLSSGRRIRKALEAIVSVGAAALVGALVWTGVAHAIA